MRIIILGIHYAPESTGNAPYTAGLAEGLTSEGHIVQVITGYPHYPEWKLKPGYTGWTSHEVINGVDVKRLRHYIPRTPKALHRLLMEISFGVRLMCTRWGNPDVILVVSPALFSSGLAILRARLIRSRPAIAIWVQDIYSRGVVEMGIGGGCLGRIMGKIEARILASADGVIAIHDRFRQYLVESLGVVESNTRVIRNWTHLPPSSTAGRQEMRDRIGWQANDIVVLHAGNMGQKQGLENVLEAAQLASNKHSPVRFILLGDGNQRGQLQNAAANINRLNFLEPVPNDEFPGILAAADILLVNEREGVKDMAVPSKLTSYFNTGLPVIAATDELSVTASEIATSGGGIRVDASNPGQLLEAAEALGRQPEMARTLGAQGLRFRREKLSESSAISQFNDFLTELALSACKS